MRLHKLLIILLLLLTIVSCRKVRVNTPEPYDDLNLGDISTWLIKWENIVQAERKIFSSSVEDGIATTQYKYWVDNEIPIIIFKNNQHTGAFSIELTASFKWIELFLRVAPEIIIKEYNYQYSHQISTRTKVIDVFYKDTYIKFEVY